MAKMSKTWWGKRFIEALEDIMEPGRLQRGRSYRSDHRILKFNIEKNVIEAEVRGNINPYFGVHKEPRYHTEIRLSTIDKKDWKRLIKQMSSNAAWIIKLLQGEMPDDLDQVFSQQGFPLLPESEDDLETTCSCPDWLNPCKHIAGVYFKMASMLDEDPFLLFDLRGLSRKELHQELNKTPLGQALASELDEQSEDEILFHDACYTIPELQSLTGSMSLKEFWGIPASYPKINDTFSPPPVSALLIKKQGDHPSFWHRDNSFIQAMEAIYEKVRQKNKESL